MARGLAGVYCGCSEVTVSENPERSPQPRETRPKAAGHVWAWIIVAVGSVIFLAIALWVIVAGNIEVDGLSDHDGIHVVSSRWADRWAQAPGPPSAYLASAGAAVADGDPQKAMRYTAMALALEPEDVAGWHSALCLSLIVPGHSMAITRAEWVGVVEALMAMDGADPGLAEVKVWRDSEGLEGRPEPTLPALCAQIDVQGSPKTERQTLDTMDVSP